MGYRIGENYLTSDKISYVYAIFGVLRILSNHAGTRAHGWRGYKSSCPKSELSQFYKHLFQKYFSNRN